MNRTKHDLNVNELMVLQSELRDREKSLGLAYLMLLGGHLGIHRFYLKRTGTAIAQLILFLASIGLYLLFYVAVGFNAETEGIVFLVISIVCGAALFIWIAVDLFLLPRMVSQWNERIERDLVEEIISYRPSNPNL